MTHRLTAGIPRPQGGQWPAKAATHAGRRRGAPRWKIDEATYDDETLTLKPGDRLYCHTDGAIEALNVAEEEFGLDRLLAEIERWRGLPLRAGLDRIAAAVRA